MLKSLGRWFKSGSKDFSAPKRPALLWRQKSPNELYTVTFGLIHLGFTIISVEFIYINLWRKAGAVGGANLYLKRKPASRMSATHRPTLSVCDHTDITLMLLYKVHNGRGLEMQTVFNYHYHYNTYIIWEMEEPDIKTISKIITLSIASRRGWMANQSCSVCKKWFCRGSPWNPEEGAVGFYIDQRSSWRRHGPTEEKREDRLL